MNIIITGASRGIGAELARKLSNAENHLFLLSRDKNRLKAIQKECVSLNGGNSVTLIPFDLTFPESQFTEVLKQIESITDHIDVLVNNAGLLINKPFEKVNQDEERRIFAANYFGPAALIRALLPLLKKSANASIVNIATMGAVQGASKFSGLSAYSASKGALSTLTECLAEEFKPLNIKVNALAIGAVETEMFKEAFPGFEAGTSAIEMASFIKWFIEEGQKRINGKIIPVSDSTP